MTFKFIDLFSGIGGFHAALSAFGGECVYAVEIDRFASKIYQDNWGIDPLADITKDANDTTMKVPPHDVLAAGFPCQPFSKAGAQLGMDETRGTVYWNILKIIQEHKPKFVILENVPNLTGSKHIHEWNIIIQTLRDEGYRVSFDETIFSPHMLPPNLGGRPQNRNRIFITATYVGDRVDLLQTTRLIEKGSVIDGWNPTSWNIAKHLPLEDESSDTASFYLGDDEIYWIDAWDEFISGMRKRSDDHPSWWPIWADDWVEIGDLVIPSGTSKRKEKDLIRNAQMYSDHKKFLDHWTNKWSVYDDSIFPKSKRKIEWQGRDSNIWDTIIHFRPSGLRPKLFNYVPALVASVHTSILGPRKRRVTVRESARLQGFPDWFDFGDQARSRSYAQLGNSVSIGAVSFIVKEHFKKDEAIFKSSDPKLLDAIKYSPDSPDDILKEKKWI